MRSSLAVVLAVLAGCATRDVLRSEAVAERAVCSGMLVGIYGRPLDIPACATEVISLGDACYVVRTEGTFSLAECAANAPDHHVMCLVDARAAVEDDEARMTTRVWVPDEPVASVTTLGRCRARYRQWIAAAVPLQEAAQLVRWASSAEMRAHREEVVAPTQELVSLDRIVPFGLGRTQLCTGPESEARGTWPGPVVLRSRRAIERANAGVPGRTCVVLETTLSRRPRPPATLPPR